MEEDDVDDGDGGAEEVEDCDEDIYGDLESDIFFAPAKRHKADDILEREEYQNLSKENHSLKFKVKQLETENRTYRSNISALYLTAKSEIDKKNFIIKNLTEKLKFVTKSKTSLSSTEVEEVLARCQEAIQESQAQVTLNEIKKSLKDVSPDSAGRRKHIKFGNMSLYFFREQGSFQREETVTFPKRKPTTAIRETPQTREFPENGETSHASQLESNEEVQNQNSPVEPPKIISESSSDAVNGHKGQGRPRINLSKSSDVNNPQETSESSEHRHRRTSSEKVHNRTENDRDRDKVHTRHSGERYNASYKNTRAREYSPPNDRHHRKGDDDRYAERERGREYESRDNYRRQGHGGSRRNSDNRNVPVKRFTKDAKAKYSSSTTALGRHTNSNSNTRSRSRSK